MTLIRNRFDGGTNGTGMTTANTGGSSGTAFTAVEVAATFSNEQSETPALSMKPPVTAASGYGRWAMSDRDIATRTYLYCTAAITSDYNFMQFRVTDQGTTATLTLRVNSANFLRAFVHSTSTNAWTASSTLPLNQWVRVECLYRQGVAANDGQVRVAYYLGDSTTVVADSGWVTGLNLRGDTGPTGNVYVGKTQTTANAASVYLDTIAINTGTDYNGFIGPDVPPVLVSPTYRWNGTAYVPLDAYRWGGTAYVPLDRVTP